MIVDQQAQHLRALAVVLRAACQPRRLLDLMPPWQQRRQGDLVRRRLPSAGPRRADKRA